MCAFCRPLCHLPDPVLVLSVEAHKFMQAPAASPNQFRQNLWLAPPPLPAPPPAVVFQLHHQELLAKNEEIARLQALLRAGLPRQQHQQQWEQHLQQSRSGEQPSQPHQPESPLPGQQQQQQQEELFQPSSPPDEQPYQPFIPAEEQPFQPYSPSDEHFHHSEGNEGEDLALSEQRSPPPPSPPFF